MTHPDQSTLNDFADGELGPEGLAEVERHLTDCPVCRSEVDGIQRLKARARELEPSVPSPDLWSGIEARIQSSSRPPLHDLERARLVPPRKGASPGPRERRWMRAPMLAAAAVVLISLSSGITWLATRGPVGGGGENVATADTSELPANGAQFTANSAAEVAAAYDPAIQQLRAVLESGRSELQPETLEVIEQALAVIDAAIRDATQALEADPGSAAALRALNGTYDSKVNLLRQAASLTRGT